MIRRTAVAAFAALGMVAATVVAAVPASARDTQIAFNGGASSTWQANGVVWALAQSGTTVYAGGSFTAIRPPGTADGDQSQQSAVNFAAFDATTGAPVSSCQASFTAGQNPASVRALDVSPDGNTLYVGGTFGTVTIGSTSVGVSNLVALNLPSCTLNMAFRPSVNATVHAIDATDAGVFFGGDFTQVGPTSGVIQPRAKLAALTAAGTLLPWAPSVDDSVRAVAVTPDGSNVFVGVSSTRSTGPPRAPSPSSTAAPGRPSTRSAAST